LNLFDAGWAQLNAKPFANQALWSENKLLQN
jgi:hypothetical protein